MAGLVFLLAIALWFALCVYLAFKIPGWLGIRRLGWMVGLLVFPVLLVAPVIDEVVGMRQFERLCKERAVVHVSPEAGQVKRARKPDLPVVALPGNWILIASQPIAYIDADTMKPFLTYEALHTNGGRIAGLALMGGTKSCWPKDYIEISKRLKTHELLEQGK